MASAGNAFLEEYKDFVLKLKIKATDGEQFEFDFCLAMTRLRRN
jgi:hypothetical protein